MFTSMVAVPSAIARKTPTCPFRGWRARTDGLELKKPVQEALSRVRASPGLKVMPAAGGINSPEQVLRATCFPL